MDVFIGQINSFTMPWVTIGFACNRHIDWLSFIDDRYISFFQFF